MGRGIDTARAVAALGDSQHGIEHFVLTPLPFLPLGVCQNLVQMMLGQLGAIRPPDLAKHLATDAILDHTEGGSDVLRR